MALPVYGAQGAPYTNFRATRRVAPTYGFGGGGQRSTGETPVPPPLALSPKILSAPNISPRGGFGLVGQPGSPFFNFGGAGAHF